MQPLLAPPSPHVISHTFHVGLVLLHILPKRPRRRLPPLPDRLENFRRLPLGIHPPLLLLLGHVGIGRLVVKLLQYLEEAGGGIERPGRRPVGRAGPIDGVGSVEDGVGESAADLLGFGPVEDGHGPLLGFQLAEELAEAGFGGIRRSGEGDAGLDRPLPAVVRHDAGFGRLVSVELLGPLDEGLDPLQFGGDGERHGLADYEYTETRGAR